MPINCPSVATTRCSINECRVYAGHSGYAGQPRIQAIVLHLLKGVGVEQYRSSLLSPCTNFRCSGPANCVDGVSGSLNPKGVHFIVTESSIQQLAEISSSTLGFDYFFNPTWPNLIDLVPLTDVNGPFIHIAIDTEQLTSTLINLLCCLSIELGYPVPIIAASDLQGDRPPLTIGTSLIAQVDACIENGGVPTPPTVADLEARVDALEECCLDNTSRIIVLEGQVSTLNTKVSNLETRMTGAEASIAYILEQIAILPTLITQIQTLTQQVADILSRCCPKQPDSACFHYQLTPGNEMLITPNQPVWLNLPTKIEDREVTCGNGNIVLPGPLWMANLCKKDDCGSVICDGSWNLEAQVRFRLSQWCAGRKVQLFLVACGVKYLLAEKVIATNAAQVVTLSGTFLLPAEPCCSDVHLLVSTNDDNTASGKVVEFASFKGCCGG